MSRVDVEPASPSVAEKLRLTFELCDAGIDLMRQNLQRRHPDVSDAEVEARLIAWLSVRPGAEEGDAEGHVVPWPRRR